MHIDEGILRTVGFIGYPAADAFHAEGNCFLLRLEQENEPFIYLVTARHLVRPTSRGIEEHSVERPVHVRFPRRNRLPLVIEMARVDWVPHADPRVDVCVAEFDLRRWDADGDLQITTLEYPSIALDDSRAGHFGFGIGSEIFIPSVFVGHEGELTNLPIVRLGSVAAMATAPVRNASPTKRAYLIETHSLGGTSGAPVFFHTHPYRMFARQELPLPPGNDERRGRIVPYLLIGLLIGGHYNRYPGDFAPAEGETVAPPTDADFNAGISVVLPIEIIMEIINCETFAKRREVTLKAIRDRITVVRK